MQDGHLTHKAKGGYIWRCDLSKQYEAYECLIDKAIKDVLKRGVYILGREVELFEADFARYIGRSHGVAVASGTDALVLALKSAGIRKGDEVIMSTYAPTPVSTAIVLAGGVPVFTDIEEETCLMNAAEAEKMVSSRTRFIIAVHIFGSVCDMPRLGAIAKKAGLVLIEDAAQAHGSVFNGKKAGNFGHLACFSFYPTKNLGCYGDGGMIVTDSKPIADRIRLLRNYGKKNNPFDSEIVGFNSRLDEVQAAVLRVKLAYLDRMNQKRSDIVLMYKKGLRGLPVRFLKTYRNSATNHHILTILCKEDRDGLVGFLDSRQIQANVYYPRPLHKMKAFRKYLKSGDRLPVSESVSKQALALPLYPELSAEKVAYVIDSIRKYYS